MKWVCLLCIINTSCLFFTSNNNSNLTNGTALTSSPSSLPAAANIHLDGMAPASAPDAELGMGEEGVVAADSENSDSCGNSSGYKSSESNVTSSSSSVASDSVS